jgi:hypothetical protein
MADWQPIVTVLNVESLKSSPPPISAMPAHAVEQATPLFLYIPVSRLIFMSIVSFSVYEVYWIYKNWRYVKERDNLDISPFWRGWFGIFYCHSLLRRIHEDKEARSLQMPLFSPNGLATGWVLLTIVSYLYGRHTKMWMNETVNRMGRRPTRLHSTGLKPMWHGRLARVFRWVG